MRPLSAAIILLVAGCSSAPPEPADKPLNFVVIMADDLGYGDLSTYGGPIVVPNIDRMAAEGLKFTDFHSNGAVCSPTRAALMTGRYQQRAGIPVVVFAPENRPTHIDGLQEVEHTFAEMLRERGYSTGIFGKWHLGYYPRYNPTVQGFDEFKGYVSGNVDFFSHVDGAGRFDWWHNVEKSDEPGYVTSLINKHAVDFIERHRDRPFCLYVPHEAPHNPYQGPNDDPKGFRVAGGFSGQLEQSAEEIKQKYREMVVEMDKGVGAILDTLERLDIAEDTLVFYISDNGATPNGSNGSLRGFKASVWEGGHRVPGIAWRPGSIEPGTATSQLAASMDIWPTIAELAGAALPSDRPLDGVDYSRNHADDFWIRPHDEEAQPGVNLDWKTFLGSAPPREWDPDRFFAWRRYWDYSGGIATDLFVHRLTRIIKACDLKTPSRVVTTGGMHFFSDTKAEAPDTFNAMLDYPGGMSVMLVSSMASQEKIRHLIRGHEGTLEFTPDGFEITPERLFADARKPITHTKTGGEDMRLHHHNLHNAIRHGEELKCDVDLGFYGSMACQMAVESFRRREYLAWDEATETVTTAKPA